MFKIDFFELLFLAEICIPPVPIARFSFFENLSEIHYKLMNTIQREKMFKFITENSKFNIEDLDCLHFFNRFNPDNQFIVLINYKNKKQILTTYLHNDMHHVDKNTFIDNQYIVSVEKTV